MGVVSKEVAVSEVNKWLDFRKVKEGDRETYAATINNLIEGVESGALIIEPDNRIRQKLEIPIEIAKVPTTEIVYNNRLKVGELRAKTAQISGNDADGRTAAFASALSGIDMRTLDEMDTADFGYVRSIVIFFT